LIDRPAKVEFDLSDPSFRLQLGQLKIHFPRLFQDFAAALPSYVGMSWEAFEAITRPALFEAAFDASYLVLRLHFLNGDLHIVAHLAEDILSLVSIHKPIIHP
jgi:hypothetical protein